jgi:hypothetical protein
MTQVSFSLLDIGTLIAIISTAVAVLGLFYTWMRERQNERRVTAMDAVANRLLPYYSTLLQAMGRINLFLYLAPTVSYDLLRVDPAELYDRAGTAFVYMRNPAVRQHALNTIQILEATDILRENLDAAELASILPNVLPLLDLMKRHIEAYLDQYAQIMKIPTPDTETYTDIAQAQSESTLTSVIKMVREARQDESQ